MKAQSAKRRKMNYPVYVKERLAREPWCALGAKILTVDGEHLCSRRAEGLHHLRKRSAGGAITCELNTLPACNPCNGWVEDDPRYAELLGLVLRDENEAWRERGQRFHNEHHEGTS